MPDYNSLRESFQDSTDLWDESLNLWDNTANLLNSLVILPNRETQIPIVTSYILAPCQLMGIVPIVFLCGAKGTGKSQITDAAVAIHGTKLLNVRSTPASLRNEIQNLRYEILSEDEKIEKNTCIAVDNLSAESLSDDFFFNLLLAGYNRRTSRITMSRGDGTNYEFDVFSKKMLSTVHPIWSDPALAELHRRSVYIFTEKSDEAHEVLDLQYVDFKKFETQLWQHWESTFNCTQYLKAQRNVANFPSRKRFKPEVWTLIKYLVPIPSLFGVMTPEETIDMWLAHFEFSEKNLSSKLPIQIVVDEFLRENHTLIEMSGGFQLKVFKAYLKSQISQGLLESGDYKPAQEYLQNLGYRVVSKGGQPHWTRQIKS